MQDNLIKRITRREPGAIEALYDRYAPSLLSVCYRYCGNRENAEDILHDGFLKIITKLDSFEIRESGSMEAWMRRIMVNSSLNFLRDRKRINFVSDPLLAIEGKENGLDHTEDQDMHVYADLDQESILQVVLQLPPGYRTVFNMYVFEDYGHKEIATTLGISENTSKSQLSKARAMLRQKLDQMILQQSIRYETL